MVKSYANTAIQRVTANLPKQLLEEAQSVTQAGITETLVEGLKMLQKRRAYKQAMALKGKINLQINLDTSRERNHR